MSPGFFGLPLLARATLFARGVAELFQAAVAYHSPCALQPGEVSGVSLLIASTGRQRHREEEPLLNKMRGLWEGERDCLKWGLA